MYIWKVKDKEYELKLSMRALLRLEAKTKKNPLMLFTREDEFPTTTEMIEIIHAAIQADTLMSEEVVCDLVDEWLEEGHDYTGFINLVLEVYRSSGLIEEEKPKNSKKGNK